MAFLFVPGERLYSLKGSVPFILKQLVKESGRYPFAFAKSQRKVKPKEIGYYLKQANNRDDAILRAWNSGGYTQKSIADYFSIHYSRVSKIIKNARVKT